MVEVGFPEFGFEVAAGGDGGAIAGECECGDAAGVCVVFADFAAVVHFPVADGSVFGGGGEDVGIGAEDGGGDGGLVCAEGVEFVGGFAFPDPDAAVAVAAGEEDAVW